MGASVPEDRQGLHVPLESSTIQCLGMRNACENLDDRGYMHGVSWCPDGTCLLTAVIHGSLRAGSSGGDESHRMAVYDIEKREPVSASLENYTEVCLHPASPGKAQGTEAIYSYAWFPHARQADVSSFCYAVARRGHPVHIVDATRGGSSRGSYVAVDERMDEMDSIYSIAFGPTGQFLYGGGRRHGTVYVFDTSRPGRNIHALFWDRHEGRDGIISSICCGRYGTALENVVAAGSYGKRVGLFDVYSQGMVCVLEGHVGGVTHMAFSADGNYLYTGARKENSIYCWDVRYLSGSVYQIERESKRTNQRIYFDIEPCGRVLATGGDDGMIRVFDLRDGSPGGSFRGASDAVNGCSFHPSEALLASSSGERWFAVEDDDTLEATMGNISVWSYPTTSYA